MPQTVDDAWEAAKQAGREMGEAKRQGDDARFRAAQFDYTTNLIDAVMGSSQNAATDNKTERHAAG